MRFKIAVVQFEPDDSDVKKNLNKAERFIKKASRKGADIIIFPENFLSKPTKNKINTFIDSTSFSKKYFQNLAKKYSIDIVVGSIIEKTVFGNRYNTTYYIDSRGKIRCRYKKVNLWDTEKRSIVPGKKAKVFRTRFGDIGLIICWDLMFPEIFRKMEKKGADIILCPSHWCYGDAKKGKKYDRDSEIKLVDSLCIDRAFENEVILVYCNSAGKLKMNNSWSVSIGHSQITEPFRGAVKKLNHNREEMFIKEIDTSILKDAESTYKIRKDLKKKSH
jgi:predicted amidohydrolase